MTRLPESHAFWLQASAPFRLALEARAGLEFASLFAAQPLLYSAPKGDGHPVLVLPRLLGCDLSTQPLRYYLSSLGYAASPWELGVNLGPRHGVLRDCLTRLEQLHAQHGRKVSLVGWSLGGLYAREMAKEAPDLVRQVITLGSPFTGDQKPVEFWKTYEAVTGDPMGLPEHHGPLDEAPPVPTTSIYSRSDGIVPWTASVEREGPRTENIEVESSHLGLAVSPLSLYAVADRLAQPEDIWRPFERSGIKGWLYRTPARIS
ncbi:alpha/beta fold hydrolase [Thiorhodococcus mannitoliphagus]|uniref:Alpha/beta fold hydrolase n=1 Tax=Thiorhodococcus mannitoliphagus TaxID=329406 RepID=A0A6P1E187_9GAMM|nr:alpha/beta hydrolase [Thiorhodococcus mannitoliphagus]NEX22806.1 alpha/beta fold hydrolase [Thiorhodococcus mannitoliphagus]